MTPCLRGPSLLIASAVLAAASISAQDRPTFRSGVRFVNVTVIAHDSSGRAVKDLAASDFRVFEDGTEQKIEVFAVDDGGITAPSRDGSAAPSSAAAAQVFTNRAPARRAGGVSVILFDRLNSTWEDQKHARDQIIRMLAKASAEDRVALYVLASDRITVLHDFTSDTSRLIAVLSNYVGMTPVELARSEEKAPAFERTGIAALDADMQAWLLSTQHLVSETFMRRRAELTTNALESVANHLAGTPGRKNLIWVSGAFPVVIPGDHGPQIMDREINRATRAINAADVAVYPVDIRGLIPALNPATATATTTRGTAPSPIFATMATTQLMQDSMEQIADATGGRAYLNGNDIGGAIRKAIDDSRVSYVLGYHSANAADDRKFRRITVKTTRPGVELRYRKGYLPPAPVARNTKTRFDALTRVMQSPIEAANIPLGAEVARMKNEGTVVVRIDPESLTWLPDKDVRVAAVDIMIAQSLPDGTYFKIEETTVNLTANADRYQRMIEDGLTVSSNFSIVPKAYRLHIVVSDVASQSAGSLIIPIVAGAQAPSQFEIVPGVGFGPIGEATTRAALVKLLGDRAIVDRPISLGEDICTSGTAVFPDTPNELEIGWRDKERTRIAFLRVSGSGSNWHTRRGVRVGTSLRELESLAGKPLTFLGFGWDYGGGMDWLEGQGTLRVELNPDPGQLENDEIEKLVNSTAEIFGDREVRSDHPVIRKMNITVNWIRQDWGQPFDDLICP